MDTISKVLTSHPHTTTIRTGDGTIVKRAKDDEGCQMLRNSVRFLSLLDGTGFSPRLLGHTNDEVVLEDVGDTQPVKNYNLFCRNCIYLLRTLRKHFIHHGDATGLNIIVRNDVPILVDWDKARFLWEPIAKRAEPDAFHLWNFVLGKSDGATRTVPRWEAIRRDPDVEYFKGWGSLLDLGCDEGYFCGMAHAEGLNAYGIDTDLDRVSRARAFFEDNGCKFCQMDILPTHVFDSDIVLLLSTFPYLVKQTSFEEARNKVWEIVQQCKVLFFESQLHKDGPGPKQFRTKEDVAEMLSRFGTIEPVVTVKVKGRQAERVTWKVRRV